MTHTPNEVGKRYIVVLVLFCARAHTREGLKHNITILQDKKSKHARVVVFACAIIGAKGLGVVQA